MSQLLKPDTSLEITEARVTSIAKALQGFARKRTDAKTEDINAFKDKLIVNLNKSASTNRFRNLKEIRKLRKQTVTRKAERLNVKFETYRFKDRVSMPIFSKVLESTKNSTTYNIVEEEYEFISPKGGYVVAYQLCLDDKGNLFKKMSIAACSKKDTFDPLLAKEIALERFENDFVIKQPVKVEKFADEKIRLITEDYQQALPKY